MAGLPRPQFAPLAQMAERILGMDEVVGSLPTRSSKLIMVCIMVMVMVIVSMIIGPVVLKAENS